MMRHHHALMLMLLTSHWGWMVVDALQACVWATIVFTATSQRNWRNYFLVQFGYLAVALNVIVLLLALTHPTWMTGSVRNVKVPYIAGSPTHIDAHVGLNLGLGGTNT